MVSGLQMHLTQTTSATSSDKPSAHLSRDSREKDSVERSRPSPSKQSLQVELFCFKFSVISDTKFSLFQTRESSSGTSGSGGTARSGLQKFQQCFGVLSVALATKALSLLSDLFDDLGLEVCGGTVGSVVTVCISFLFN